MFNEPNTVPDILERIEQLEKANNSIEAYLPYADHGAYGQDKRRIADNLRDINYLMNKLDSIQ